MLNPIFWKKVQWQNHPGRWGIAEHRIPSIKVLFKTNAKGHKHPGIKLLSSESKTQLVNQRKLNSYRKRVYIYIYYIYSTQSFWTRTKVIRRKHIIQSTIFGACSSTCCQWDGEDVPAPCEWWLFSYHLQSNLAFLKFYVPYNCMVISEIVFLFTLCRCDFNKECIRYEEHL